MKIIRQKSVLVSCGISMMYTSGVVAAFISLLTLVFTGSNLTPFKVFTLLSIINVLRNSALRSIAEGLHFIYEAYVSFGRIQEFLVLPEMHCLTDGKHSSKNGKDLLFANKRIGKVVVDVSDGLTYFNEYTKKSCIITKFVKIQDDHNGNNPLSSLGLSQTELKKACEPDTKAGIKLSNVTCKIIDDNKIPLRSITFEARDKTLTVITGPVGSGKSTLLSLIACEMPTTAGNIEVSGSIAYVPQIPWVFSGTLRENILFGRPFQSEKYFRTIYACALEEDIERFPDRDQVVIGERGNTLSGGQQARVSLARAVYADCDIYLLDNPLAAIDANVGDFIFKHCILGMLSDKLRLMVSHKEYSIKSADQVIILRDGSVIAKGKFEELHEDEAVKDFLEPRSNRIGNEARNTLLLERQSMAAQWDRSENILDKSSRSMATPEEDRVTGTVSFKLYWDYLRAGLNPVALVALIIIFILSQGKKTSIYWSNKAY